jgi:hypothetical protein
MNINYKITQLDRIRGSIRVLYWTEDYPEGYLFDLDLPIENGETINLDQLPAWIMERAPAAQLEWAANQKQLVADVDFSHIESLIETPPAVTPTPDIVTSAIAAPAHAVVPSTIL